MAYLVKQKLYYYKKYKVDIWGFLHNTLQVLHDNTLYKVYKTYKYQKYLKKALKQTMWLFYKYQKKVMVAWYIQNDLNKLAKTKHIMKHWNTKYKRLLIKNFERLRFNERYIIVKNRCYKKAHKYRHILINKLISSGHRWNYFAKYTISKRLCNIFNILLEKKTEEIRIFYRRPFIYEPRLPLTSRRKRLLNYEYTTYRLLKIFFVMYSYNQLRNIMFKAKLQNGVFEHNFMTIIESKLPSYLYRSSLFPTIFESLNFVKQSNVWVNKEYKPLIYYHVKLFDIVGFRPFYKSYIIWAFFKRLRRRAFLFLFPECIYISLCFLFIILIKRIRMEDIINAFEFDYYRMSDYLQ